MHLSAIDKKILNVIQQDIPLSPRPFAILARKAGVSEEKLLEKIKEFKEKRLIRVYSAGLSHKRLGFKSTLIALRVPGDRLTKLVDYLIKFREVTHCYLRKGEFNLWFVFLYKNDRLKNVIDRISREIGKENILNLKTLRQFKLKTKLGI